MASGDYPTVVDEVVYTLGGVLVDAVDVQPGQRVLDIAAGTGTSAIPSARRGADVVATDLTPELLDVGRAAAAAEGLDLTWQTADAEALPFGNGSSTSSCRASASCSRRTTSSPRTNSSGCAVRAGPSES